MTNTGTAQSENRKRVRFIVFNGIVAALYVIFTAPFANIAYGPIQVRIAVVISMLSVAASEAVLLIVLGIPLVIILEKTGLKNKLP